MNYFPEDNIVKDGIYTSLSPLLICPICKNLFKEPLMCSGCQNVYCKICINDKKCLNNCVNNTFSPSISKNELLSKLKYRCKNCSKVVIQGDIQSHIDEGCSTENKGEKTLAELFKTKKELTRLSKNDMAKYKKEEILRLRSKNF